MKKTLGRRIEESYLMLVGIISLFLITGYFSYAYFTLQTEQKNRISIIAGTLNVEMKVDGTATNKLTVQANTTKEFTVTIKNINDRTARYNFYYTGTLASGVEAGYVNEDGVNTPPEAKGINIEKDQVQTYKIRVKNGTSSSQIINLVSDVGLDYNDLELPSNGHLFAEAVTGPNAVEELLEKYVNSKTYENSTSAEKKNMYVFEHTAGSQQAGYSAEELKDYRYVGQDPNNYVTFNGETAGWRIIGVFTVEDGEGNKEKRIKLIRKDPLPTNSGKAITFDNKRSGTGSSTSEYGSNDWTDSRLMYLLNPEHESEKTGVTGSIYWKQGSGNCPYGGSNGTKACDFSSIGLNEEARGMIGDTKWYLGGTNSYTTSANGTVDKWYSYERGTTVYQSSSHPRQTYWKGEVGLMYPSDYGYATGGSSGDTSRTKCLAKELSNWKESAGYKDCATNDWLYDSSNYQWTIAPYSGTAYYVFFVNNSGYVSHSYANLTNGVVRPVVYLASNVKVQGTGTSSDPFVFSK